MTGTQYILASDYDAVAAESEARHQSCLVLMKSVQDHRARIAQIEAALKVTHQALIETMHAQEVGASWYTKGESGLYQQVHMWVRKGLEAIAACSVSENTGNHDE